MNKCWRLIFPAFLFPAMVIMTVYSQCVVGQDSAEVSYYSQYYGRFVSRYSGGTLTVEVSDTPHDYTREGCSNGGTVCGHWEGNRTAQVSNLVLEGVAIQQGCCDEFGLTSTEGYGFLVPCKGGKRCVSDQGHFTGYTEGLGNGNGSAWQLVVSCGSRDECSEFLEALKGRRKPDATTVQRLPPVRTEPSVQTPAQKPAPISNDKPSDPLREILDSISRRNGKAGNSSLDQLERKTEPTARKPLPPVSRAFYAAFAQSGGFNANDGWGAATGPDLNSAIASANTACVNRAGTTCGDEGYCMMRPGLWSAWASDLKYLGGKAFACNLKTEEDARNQALAWCGSGCRVLWAGEGL